MALLALALALAGPVAADPLDGAAVNADPQFYAMSLPSGPVAEIADEVLGEALGVPVEVSPEVTGEMAFRVEGVFTPRDLAKEFGYRLWNVDAVLVDRGAEGLAIVPRAGLADALAKGAEVVSPLAAAPAGAAPKADAKHRPIRYGDRRWDHRPWTPWLMLALGWVFGVASFATFHAVRRRSD